MAKAVGLDESVKGTVFSAFYWGYALSQIPGGALAQRYGGGPLLILAFVALSLIAFSIPSNAKRVFEIILARISTGIFQGFIIPSVHTVLSQWIPPTDRAKATSMTTSGMYLGSAAAMWLLPSIANSFGADGLLLAVGCLGSACALSWYWLGDSKPASNDEELPMSHNEKMKDEKKQRKKTPWKQILTSMAVWCIVVNNFTFHYAVYVVMNWLPTYFNELLHAELASVGTIKILPFILMFATSNAGGWLGDFFIMKWRMSVAHGRKIVNTIGFLLSCISLLSMAKAKSLMEGVTWTSLVMGCLGLSRGGFSVNHMDIAPRFAGIVMGISNTAGTVAGVIGVAMTGILLERNGGSSQTEGWNYAFAIAAALCVMGSIFFVRAAKGDKLFD